MFVGLGQEGIATFIQRSTACSGFKMSNRVSVVGNECKFILNDLMDVRLPNARVRSLHKAKICFIFFLANGRFLGILLCLTKRFGFLWGEAPLQNFRNNDIFIDLPIKTPSG